MENALYRRNVMRTLSQKPAKLGLKFVARNTRRTNVFHAAVGLASETMELIGWVGPYILGVQQFKDQMKLKAFEEMGDCGYYMAVLAKFLRVKLPGSGKKIKLKGRTRGEALLELNQLASSILDLAKKTFYGPEMQEKKVIRKKKVYTLVDGKKSDQFTYVEEPVDVQVLDPQKTEKLFENRYAEIAKLVEQYAQTYTALSYDMFEAPPANLYVGNIAKLELRYGKGFFELSEAEERDLEAEDQALSDHVSTNG